MEVPEIDIHSRLKEISKMGFVKSLRKSDTGIGFTLEKLMGIRENNVKNEDFTYLGSLVELKAQRQSTTSNITLFTKEPEKGKIKDGMLIQRYGYKNGQGRNALKITLNTKEFTPQQLKLSIDKKEAKIIVVHKKDGRLWFWDANQLASKISNLLLVFAETKKLKGLEYFHFNEAYYFTHFKNEAFFDLLEHGEIVVDLRMHVRQNGTVRNHGTAFRIADIKDVEQCYEKRGRIV